MDSKETWKFLIG